MRNEVAVEMTLDRAIRVVNHAHKAVAATNGRGNASCIYHVAAKIYQARSFLSSIYAKCARSSSLTRTRVKVAVLAIALLT